jgi:signal peptidase I
MEDNPESMPAASEPPQPQASVPSPPPPPPVRAPSYTPSAPPKKPSGTRSFLKELPILIVIAFGLALLIKTFLLQAFFIPSESMVPTLKVGDRVLVNKLVYRIHEPRRGDIIVFIENPGPKKSFLGRVRSFLTEGLGVTKPASKDFIKRVIALPGEKIQIKNGVVTITPKEGNPFQLNEPYLNQESKDVSDFPQFTVPADTYFVMGDNRANSADSRTALGPIRREVIVGRAFIRIWPLGRFGFFHRPKYQTTAAAGLTVLPIAALSAGFVVRRRRAA